MQCMIRWMKKGVPQDKQEYTMLEIKNVSKSENIYAKPSLHEEKNGNKKLNYSLWWILFVITTITVLLLYAIAFIATVVSSHSQISNLKAKLAIVENISDINSDNFKKLNSSTGELSTTIMSSNTEVNRALKTAINTIDSNIQIILNIQKFTISSIPFASSCKDIFTHHSSLPSGYYWLILSNGSSIKVYCEMKMTCDGVTGGWMGVAKLNKFNNGSAQCFENLTNYGNNNSLCIRNTSISGCSHVFFQVFNIQYSHVCGTVQGYGQHSPDGFLGNLNLFGHFQLVLLKILLKVE